MSDMETTLRLRIQELEESQASQKAEAESLSDRLAHAPEPCALCATYHAGGHQGAAAGGSGSHTHESPRA